MPKFPETSCSQCGGSFGPGNHGFSHCSQHEYAAATTPALNKHRGLYIVPAAHFCAGLGFYVSDDPDCVPAWDERGYAGLAGCFDTIRDAKNAIDAEAA